jgi:DNA polymerase III subunit gamma/tau
MATQSLYRRYRPRRFSELKGQEHVVRALREAVRTGREGQAYLFSGPRGTGKTTSARILAKVLNCERPVDGEPCCECESCLAVERGVSYDVHELDAASNNGVDNMRDLIEKASLGTPGRHKVYILDEVHMLSKGAEAALLKTLEEPPPHVVFVLATTDPQKVSETIRSRTQHLQFHLLPADTLAEHVRWVAGDAGLELSDEALDAAVAQGGGSARDTLSALELMAAGGGELGESVDLDEFLRAMIDHDPGRALTAVAHAVSIGRDPKLLTDEVVRHLRDAFLTLMAPELVTLPGNRVDQLAELAQRLGAAACVRAIERLGAVLIDMRHAPDPRVLLDVAMVQLTHEPAGLDVSALAARLERLEKLVADGGPVAARAPEPPPVDPTTGRAVIGARAKRSAPAATDAAGTGAASARSAVSPSAASSAASGSSAPLVGATPDPGVVATPAEARAVSATVASAADQATPATDTAATAGSAASTGAGVPDAWNSTVKPGLKPLVRALFSAGGWAGHDGDTWRFGVPTEPHREKCEAHRPAVEAALSAAVGRPIALTIVVGVDPLAVHDPAPATATRPSAAGSSGPSPTPADAAVTLDDEEHIDLDDLTDVPPESVLSPIDRLAQAFPGAELVEESD